MDLNTRKQNYRSHLILAIQYYRQPTPTPAEWREDLIKIKDMGMEMIQLRPQWRWHERQEGTYLWDDIDRLLDLAQEIGLRVMFKFMLESAPGYIYRKYNGYRVGIHGEKIWPIGHAAFYPGGWLPCFDNPEVIKHACQFVQNAVERYRNRDVIDIWHAWNEPRSRPMGECCCEHSQTLYHQWLEAKFKNIDNLNDFYGKAWADFVDVDVPHDTSDFVEMHLWRQWAATRVAWRVEQVSKAIKAVDPTREVIAHVGMPSVVQDVLEDTSDDYLTRQSVDFYGSSFEARYAPAPLDRSWPFLMADWMRAISGDGYFWINELYPSRGQWRPELPADTIVSWLWSAVACGAKGVVFWQYKKERLGQEVFEAGLVDTDARDNETSLAVRDTLATINANKSLFANTQVSKAKVALVYDFNSDLVSRIEESGHLGDLSLTRKGYLPADYAYKTALQGAYHLFWSAGVSVDMISSHDLSNLTDYEIVYVPAMFMVDKKQADVFKDYVAQGGRLIAEGGTGQRDGNTWLHPTRPGAGLGKLFGLSEPERLVYPNDQRRIILPTGEQVDSPYMNAFFSLTTAKALAHDADGRVVMAENSFGQGSAVMTGFSSGLAYLLNPDPAWVKCLCWLIRDQVSIETDSFESQHGLYVRRLESGTRTIYFLFNVQSKAVDCVMPCECRELISAGKYHENSIMTIAPSKAAVVVVENVAMSQSTCRLTKKLG